MFWNIDFCCNILQNLHSLIFAPIFLIDFMSFPLTVLLDYCPGRKYAQRVGSRVQTQKPGTDTQRRHSPGSREADICLGKFFSHWRLGSSVGTFQIFDCPPAPKHSPSLRNMSRVHPYTPSPPLAQTQPPPSAHLLPTPSYSHFRRIKGPASGDLEPALDMELSFCLTVH